MKGEDFVVRQISTACLAQFGYIIESGDDCAVIDPLRDLAGVENYLTESGKKLKYIILTHFHADFVSGHFELQNKTGASILLGPTAEKFQKVTDKKKLTI